MARFISSDSQSYNNSYTITRELLSGDKLSSDVINIINTDILKLSSYHIPKQTSKQCNVTWNSGSIAYKCRDCQFDSTCVICVECFQKSDHKGHDYSITKTGGGCCDCGDVEAWDPKGFCSDHCLSNDIPHPSTIIKDDLLERIFGCCQAASEIIYQCCNFYSRMSRIERKNMNDKTIIILSWMENLCKTLGDTAKWILGVVFCSSFSTFNPYFVMNESLPSGTKSESNLLLSLFLKDESISPMIQTELHKLYFNLLGDSEFKESFARNFIKYYKVQLHTMGTDIRSDLLTFSVQIFSTPSLVPMFIETKFVFQLFKRFEELLESLMIKHENNEIRLNWTSSVFTKGYYQSLLFDLRYLFSLHDIASFILFKDTKHILSNFVQLFANINEAYVHTRIPAGRDCLNDDDIWATCWTLEDNLITLSSKLLNGFEITNDQTKQICLSKIRVILQQTFSHLLQLKAKVVVGESGNFNIVKFQVSKDKVTLSIPLHKFISQFLQKAVIKHNISLQDIVSGLEPEFSCFLVEHPLRLQVLFAQVAAKMWVRNGYRFQWVASIYRYNVKYYSHLPKDIFLLQCASVIMQPEHFFLLLLERYELNQIMYFNPRKSTIQKEWSISQITTILEHFFELIIILITNRTMIGTKSLGDKIKYYFKHLLFLKATTHSELMKNSFTKYSKYPHVSDILSEIADFDTKPMLKGEPGTYIIKKEMWNDLDPYFLHYNPSELQIVNEKYFNIKSDSSKSKIVPIPIPSTVNSSFNSILNLLQSKFLHRILFWSIYYGVEKENNFKWKRDIPNAEYENDIYSSITTIHQSLHLLYLSCAMYNNSNTNSSNNNCDNENINIISNEKEIYDSPLKLPFLQNDIIINITQSFTISSIIDNSPQEYSILSLLLKLHKNPSLGEYIESIFTILKDKGKVNNNKINELLFEYENSLQSNNTINDDHKKLLQKQKQQEILDSFKKRQNQFLRESDHLFIDDDNDDLFLDDDQPICAVCKDSCLPNIDNPVGLVGYQQKSKIIQFHRSKHDGEIINNSDNLNLENHDNFLRSDNFRLFNLIQNLQNWEDNTNDVNQPLINRRVHVNENEENKNEKNEDDSNESPISNLWNEITNPNSSLEIQYCQHTIHISCYQKYFDSLVKQYRNRPFIGIDIQASEFNCPVCRTISNIIVPLPPKDLIELSDIIETKKETIDKEEEEEKEDEKEEEIIKYRKFNLIKNVYDTFAMNCSLVMKISYPKYYIPFHIAYDSIYISNFRSMPESIEFRTRNEIIPSIVYLAENRGSVQQVYQSLLGYKKCCNIDRNYDRKSMNLLFSKLNYFIFGNNKYNSTNDDILPNNLMECDIFGILISYLFYKSDSNTTTEEFDIVVYHLFIALINQIILHIERNQDKNDISNNINIQYTEDISSCSFLKNIIELIIEKRVHLKIRDSKQLQYIVINRSLLFLRKVYILRHTLFDIYFSSLPQEQSSSPVSVLCNILFQDTKSIENIDNLLNQWNNIEDSITIRKNEVFTEFNFIDLPKQYSFTLNQKYTNYICDCCNEKPKKPALCLLCGTILCAESKCCSVNGLGECNRHLQTCCSSGVFLLLYSTLILLLQNGTGCILGSIYLDKHGEVDENLRRGKELYLNEIKLESLKNIFLKQKIISTCKQNQPKDYSFVYWGKY